MVSDFPGLRLLVSPMSPLGLLLPALPFPLFTYPGFAFPWELKHKGLFEKFKCDTVSLCAADGRALLFTADVPFITELSSFASREVFPKPVDAYKVLSYLGSNLVVCEGEAWRRQRRIGAPAFSKSMFERLWIDMRDIVREMVEEERWEERTSLTYPSSLQVTDSGYTLKPGEIMAPHVVDLTLRMALAAIARAGFGMDFEWEAEASFTHVCQTFGNPQRWTWWLAILRWIWGICDVIFAPLACLFRPVITVVPAHFGPKASAFWKSAPLLPLRLVWVVMFYFLEELWTLFARPTEADFNPRKIKVHEALHLVAKDSTLRLAVPTWMMYLPFRRMRRMRIAFTTLEAELRRLAAEGKQYHQDQLDGRSQFNSASPQEERSDLMNNLVKAAMMDEAEMNDPKGSPSTGIVKGLTDEEIVGNIYIYFLAGHETTAHSLAWTLALLAAYPSYQDAVIEEINRVWPPDHSSYEPFRNDTSMDDYAKFPFVLACYWETLRLFPPVQMIPKLVAKDVAITVQASNVNPSLPNELPLARPKLNAHHSSWSSAASTLCPPTPVVEAKTNLGESGSCDTSLVQNDTGHTRFAVKKGTIVFVDPPGVHYNPQYWEDPETFDPTRFMRTYNKEAFIPFGVGHRACLGRKFSEVESVAMLIHLLKNYSVHLVPSSANGTVDVEAARAKFSRASVRITLTPAEIPLIFRRR
ncbi:hypothetical protein M408DRAFT_50530, partial [Serendipita vermifera MAFF 305830]